MKYSILLFILVISIACDAPQRTRYPTNDYSTIQGFDNGNESGYDPCESSYEDDCATNGSNGNNTNAGTNSSNGSTNSSNGSTGNSGEMGFETCSNTTPHYGGSVGYFGLCQHDDDERQYKTRFNQSDLTIGTCFVPINIQNGKSFNLGIAECVHNQANRDYYMTLNKQRPEPINGVMVLKASAVNSYMQCMNAKANYIAGHPGCQFNPACLAAADQYAYATCNAFVQQHSNDYKQVEFY